MKLQLDQIRIDGHTQQRPIDQPTVDRYTALMQDGVVFPPIDVVYDGKDYWLWNGFHRYHATASLDMSEIEANSSNGTQRDAIYFSFGANKVHGLPRQPGVAKEIIAKMLCDDSWSKISHSDIAKHVGVTRQYVGQVKEQLPAHGASTCTIEPDSEAKNGDSHTQAVLDALNRSDEIEVTRSGKTYTQKSQEKEKKPKEPLKDQIGNVLPEHLSQLYLKRSVLNDYSRKLAKIRNIIEKHMQEDTTGVFKNVGWTKFKVDIDNAKRALRFAMPYAICPYCGGEDAHQCRACDGLGMVTRLTYDHAPRELKGGSHG